MGVLACLSGMYDTRSIACEKVLSRRVEDVQKLDVSEEEVPRTKTMCTYAIESNKIKHLSKHLNNRLRCDCEDLVRDPSQGKRGSCNPDVIPPLHFPGLT
jgi:hypothetical protein